MAPLTLPVLLVSRYLYVFNSLSVLNSLIRFFLFPFSYLYAMLMYLRNRRYDASAPASPGIPVLAVGNLSVGGTGKTPHVEYLLQWLLARGHRPAMLSRGYGRSTKGVFVLKPASDATQAGDEPLQVFHRFGAQVPVVVAEKRTEGAMVIRRSFPEVNALVLDDAFQHRAIHRDLNILLSDWQKPFFNDWVLPAGRLREARQGAARADILIFTKCPPLLSQAEQKAAIASASVFLKAGTPVCFTGLKYGELQAMRHSQPLLNREAPVALLSGLAYPEALLGYTSANYALQHQFRYPDHHPYSTDDMRQVIGTLAKTNISQLITTAKDAVKLQRFLPLFPASISLFVLPVEIYFIEGAPLFEAMLSKAVSETGGVHSQRI
jgi:tetraacyldisaccharide 4'-kinase